MEKIKADSLALNAVIRAVSKGPQTTLEDLKRRDFSKIFYTWDCC